MSFMQPKGPAPVAAAAPPPVPTSPEVEAAAVAARRRAERMSGGRALTMLGAQTPQSQAQGFVQKLLGAMTSAGSA